MKKSGVISTIVLLLTLSLAFQYAQMEEWPDNAKKLFKEKTEIYRKIRLQKCKDRARSIAGLMVDSVMTGKKILIPVDTFKRPYKPQKPEKPDFPYKVDTTAPDKLFQIDKLNR
jgi:ribosomal protein S12 methylthiotransferase accessory factor YcaO